MNGFRVMGRVLWTGTKNTAWRIWWYQGALGLTGGERAGAVTLRLFGSLAAVWFGGGTLLFLGWLPYVVPTLWLVAVGVLADVAVDDTEPRSPTGVGEGFAEEEAGQSVGFVTIDDLDNPSRSRVVWVRKDAA